MKTWRPRPLKYHAILNQYRPKSGIAHISVWPKRTIFVSQKQYQVLLTKLTEYMGQIRVGATTFRVRQ